MTPDELERAGKYIASVHWQFARTRPWNPHWYCLKTSRPELAGEFEWFVQFIRDEGSVVVYGKAEYVVLIIGEYRYWSMGAPVDQTELVNRTYHDQQKWEEARQLCYAESKKHSPDSKKAAAGRPSIVIDRVGGAGQAESDTP
jgi:hypothetical protein